jgi:hypothetical protein
VLFAEAVTSITFDDTTVMVTFDPPTAGAEEQAFLAANPFDTLAEFAGIPIAFGDDQGRRLRTRVEKVTVALPDGRTLVTVTRSAVYRRGTGGAWKQGL